ncbi:hypothetical protein XA68_11104 [Ophiocordyceps unilateralis]|uniref:Uncharacterized protein n=1 Tax=Ophiocordyceps unilateralis TaxID=268505 RepID=A0A2A9P2A0_OPHUN|nr:hypothetical protein XA68_11104 [Ophiocordyceps unilateralis]
MKANTVTLLLTVLAGSALAAPSFAGDTVNIEKRHGPQGGGPKSRVQASNKCNGNIGPRDLNEFEKRRGGGGGKANCVGRGPPGVQPRDVVVLEKRTKKGKDNAGGNNSASASTSSAATAAPAKNTKVAFHRQNNLCHGRGSGQRGLYVCFEGGEEVASL